MKLFWKLFLTLGVAMTVAMVAAVTMGWQVGQLALEQFFDFNFENREAVINRASQALNRGGREELTSWLRQNQTPVPGRMLLIIDDRSEDLLGREIPEDARRFLRWQSGQSDRRWENFGAGRNRMGPQFTEVLLAPNGESFRILFDTTAITLLNILRMPATQVGVVTLAIIMAAATALLLAKSFSSPIVRLQRATRALAAGTLEARVGAPFDRRKDEVGTLARDFDAMAEKVQALITDKEVLLRDVSHELRSPLARIRVALALAQRKADVSAQEDLERIDQETERLDQLVGQILTLARLRSSRLEQHVDVDLNTLVGEVVADARFEQADARISFETATCRGSRATPASSQAPSKTCCATRWFTPGLKPRSRSGSRRRRPGPSSRLRTAAPACPKRTSRDCSSRFIASTRAGTTSKPATGSGSRSRRASSSAMAAGSKRETGRAGALP